MGKSFGILKGWLKMYNLDNHTEIALNKKAKSHYESRKIQYHFVLWYQCVHKLLIPSRNRNEIAKGNILDCFCCLISNLEFYNKNLCNRLVHRLKENLEVFHFIENFRVVMRFNVISTSEK